MKFACQILVVLLLGMGFFHGLYEDFEGRKAHEPWGFSGAIVTIVVTAVVVVLYACAGLFSEFH